jgi:hypothetical protein
MITLIETGQSGSEAATSIERAALYMERNADVVSEIIAVDSTTLKQKMNKR